MAFSKLLSLNWSFPLFFNFSARASYSGVVIVYSMMFSILFLQNTKSVSYGLFVALNYLNLKCKTNKVYALKPMI